MPVEEGTQDLCLAEQFGAVLVAQAFGGLDAGYGIVAALDTEIALGPHILAEARYGRRDVELGVTGAGRTVHHVRYALDGEEIGVGVNRFDRYVAAVDHGLAFGLVPEEVFRSGDGRGVLLEGAGLERQDKSCGKCQVYIFHFHISVLLSI